MKTYLSSDPEIYIIDNFLSENQCDHMINKSKERLKRALVAGNNIGYVSKGRSGKNCWMPHNIDKIFSEIAEKISNLVDYSLNNAESFQVIYYDTDQQYRNHYDAWKFDNSDKSARCLLRGGQRMVTALVYLNDVEFGGETRFTKLDINVKAKKGRLLVFHNCLKDSNVVHPLTEHAGMPVIKGEKYAFNLWFRQQSKNIDYVHDYSEIINN